MNKLSPLHGNLLVKRIDTNSTAKIVLPDEIQKQELISGIIRATTPGKHIEGTYVPCKLKVGDTIYYNEYSASKIHFGNDDYDLVDFMSAGAMVAEDESDVS